MAIVTSFIENNRHTDLNSLVPVIMMCLPTTVICLYDCITDELLLSETFEWIAYDSKDCGTIVKSGIFLLWIAIHHRYKYKCYNILSLVFSLLHAQGLSRSATDS